MFNNKNGHTGFASSASRYRNYQNEAYGGPFGPDPYYVSAHRSALTLLYRTRLPLLMYSSDQPPMHHLLCFLFEPALRFDRASADLRHAYQVTGAVRIPAHGSVVGSGRLGLGSSYLGGYVTVVF